MEKVIDLEDRIPSFRERRKRRTNFKFILLTTVFVLVLFFLLYLQSSYSKVQKIVVEGAVLEQQQFYIDKLQIATGQSMWSFTINDVEEQLKQLEWVKSADVKRKLLTTITINIKEYKKVAFLNEGDMYYPMLENGYIFKELGKQLPIDAPVLMDFTDENLRKRLLKELPKIDESILTAISQINANTTEKDPFAITLYMNDGYEIRADITTLAEKINYYPSIIAQIESAEKPTKGVIDIEVGTYYQTYENEYGAMPIDTGANEDLGEKVPTGAPVETESSEQIPDQNSEQQQFIEPSSEGA
ncbi:MAG: FtsQ-type POTRA domain-containing protein [Lysinibacillus sp.]